MDKRLEMNLKIWGISFEKLNEMSYEEIKKLPTMNKSLLFAIMNEITNIETIRNYMKDNRRSLV